MIHYSLFAPSTTRQTEDASESERMYENKGYFSHETFPAWYRGVFMPLQICTRQVSVLLHIHMLGSDCMLKIS